MKKRRTTDKSDGQTCFKSFSRATAAQHVLREMSTCRSSSPTHPAHLGARHREARRRWRSRPLCAGSLPASGRQAPTAKSSFPRLRLLHVSAAGLRRHTRYIRKTGEQLLLASPSLHLHSQSNCLQRGRPTAAGLRAGAREIMRARDVQGRERMTGGSIRWVVGARGAATCFRAHDTSRSGYPLRRCGDGCASALSRLRVCACSCRGS